MNYFGKQIKTTIFGESHGPCIGALIDSPPCGVKINIDLIKERLAKRRPNPSTSTNRVEEDDFKIISGTLNNVTTGAPVCIIIENKNVDDKVYDDKYVKNATCTLQEDISPNDGELAQAHFICSVQLTQTEYNNTDFEEITISTENEEINGVSDLDQTVANPFKTDKALEEIKRKKANNETINGLAYVVDYYEEEVKPTPLFTINNLYIDGCNTTGKFIISGSFSDDMESMKFDLVLTYPSTEIKCEFDDAEKNEIINMTCKVNVGFEYVEAIFFEQRLIKKNL